MYHVTHNTLTEISQKEYILRIPIKERKKEASKQEKKRKKKKKKRKERNGKERNGNGRQMAVRKYSPSLVIKELQIRVRCHF